MSQHQRLIERPPAGALETALEFSRADERVVDAVVIVMLRDLLRPHDVLDAAADGVRRARLAEVTPAVRELVAEDHPRPLRARQGKRTRFVRGVLSPENQRMLQPRWP